MIIDYQFESLLKNYLDSVIVVFGQADVLGLRRHIWKTKQFRHYKGIEYLKDIAFKKTSISLKSAKFCIQTFTNNQG